MDSESRCLVWAFGMLLTQQLGFKFDFHKLYAIITY